MCYRNLFWEKGHYERKMVKAIVFKSKMDKISVRLHYCFRPGRK